MDESSRVVNLSSAAQATVDIHVLEHGGDLRDDVAYAQSKLALTMWSAALATSERPMIVSVNPKSFLGSKMVRDAYGMQGHDLRLGADILYRAALSDEFANANGKYYDNDLESFANPHPDAMNAKLCKEVVDTIERIIAN